VRREGAAAGAALHGALVAQSRVVFLGLGLVLGGRGFEVLETELKLLLWQSLRFPPELHTAQLQQ
jgi:hypothetical protein